VLLAGRITYAFFIYSPQIFRTTKQCSNVKPPLSFSTLSDLDYTVQQEAVLDDLPSRGVVIILAIMLGLLSQILINSMLKGDRGLSAFLSDGKGYGKSNFKPYTKGNDKGKQDPLPWLKLPKLSYVEVAGQEDDMVDLKKETKAIARSQQYFDNLQPEKSQATKSENN
jgi:hypothetical protein